MHDLFAHAVMIDQFKREIVILVAAQPGPQAIDHGGKGEPHLDPRIRRVEIRKIIVQRIRHDFIAECLLCVLVKAPHDPGHVDTFFPGIQADGASYTGFERQIPAFTGVKPDWQAEV